VVLLPPVLSLFSLTIGLTKFMSRVTFFSLYLPLGSMSRGGLSACAASLVLPLKAGVLQAPLLTDLFHVRFLSVSFSL
jgi:hypothetical protein